MIAFTINYFTFLITYVIVKLYVPLCALSARQFCQWKNNVDLSKVPPSARRLGLTLSPGESAVNRAMFSRWKRISEKLQATTSCFTRHLHMIDLWQSAEMHQLWKTRQLQQRKHQPCSYLTT